MTFRKIMLAAAGLSILVAAPALAASFIVAQVGLTFVPDDLTIEQGDTVEWIWSGGSHTVTNGTGPSDPNVGTLFDMSLNSGSPSQSFIFNDVGDVPYFCRPHFTFDMTGVIHVQESVPNEGETWGQVKSMYR